MLPPLHLFYTSLNTTYDPPFPSILRLSVLPFPLSFTYGPPLSFILRVLVSLSHFPFHNVLFYPSLIFPPFFLFSLNVYSPLLLFPSLMILPLSFTYLSSLFLYPTLIILPIISSSLTVLYIFSYLSIILGKMFLLNLYLFYCPPFSFYS